ANSSARPSLTVQLSVVQSIHVFTGSGADRLQIQSTGGIVTVPHGIEFSGGSDVNFSVDTLVLNNASDTQGATGRMLSGGIVSSLASDINFPGDVEAIQILFGSGNDNFDGSAANVPLTLVGGRGADTLTGGSRGDTFDSRDGLGNDHLFGGPG